MEFDKSKFLKAGFVPRTAEVEVPALKDYFKDRKKDEVPKWKVRGLTGHEVARIREKLKNQEKVQAILQGLVSTKTAETTEAIKTLTGNTEDTPQDAIYRLHLLVTGSVNPGPDVVDMDFAGRLLQFFGVTFYSLTDTILILSGRGHEPGKARSSGTTPESGRD